MSKIDFSLLAVEGVQGLSPYQAGKPIEELQRELGLTKVVKLASNENPLGPSPVVLKALEKTQSSLTRYPDSSGFSLKQALANKYSVKPEQIALGNGSNDLLDLIARVFLKPSVSAVYSEHGFIVYPIAIQATGAEAIVVPATKDKGHDLPAMAKAITPSTRLVFLANPNNPTGTFFTKALFADFMQSVPADVVVVLDEAYFEYANNADYPDGVDYLAKYPNLIVSRTFSKAYGLAGLRVGYTIASAEITGLLNRVRAPFNVNSQALVAAEVALSDVDYLQRSCVVNQQGMAQLEAGLAELSLSYIPSLANFITVKMPGDTQVIYQKLLEEGVIVRPIAVYGLSEYLRVSIGTNEENATFLIALKKVLQQNFPGYEQV